MKQTTNPLDLLQRPHLPQHARARRPAQTARQFDRLIRRELRRCGAALWGVDYGVSVSRIHRHGVRFETGAQIHRRGAGHVL